MTDVRYVEDYRPGELFELGIRTITEREIVEFASRYDPMPFHLDKEAAARSIYGGLTASGWQSCLIMIGMMHKGFICMETSLGSPGMEFRWLKPVRPGDRLTGRVEVEEVRVSRSKPEMGFVTNTATLTNQDGEVVYRTRNVAIFRSRPA
jgi:acyl dehydratase